MDGIINSMDMGLGGFQELVMDRDSVAEKLHLLPAAKGTDLQQM